MTGPHPGDGPAQQDGGELPGGPEAGSPTGPPPDAAAASATPSDGRAPDAPEGEAPSGAPAPAGEPADAGTADHGGAAATSRPRRRRDPLAASLIGVLTLLLGFAFAVQVRSTDTDEQLAGAREEDLLRILDDVTAQEDRLQQEIQDQRVALDSLGDSDTAAAAALQEAQERAESLGILNGTLPARGPGLEITLRDPSRLVDADVLLNAVQELRGAGAETMQIDDVRIGVSSAVTGSRGQLAIDGRPLEAPYVVRVIGSPQDMATALTIPGGVAARVSTAEGSLDVVQSSDVVVDALRPLDEPQYAEPADD